MRPYLVSDMEASSGFTLHEEETGMRGDILPFCGPGLFYIPLYMRLLFFCTTGNTEIII